MNCLFCKELSQALEAARSEYLDARLSLFFKVSTELAASKQVEMDAKTCLFEHHLTCAHQKTFQVIRFAPVKIASAVQWKMIA